jgi:hypothetical protein
MVTWSMLHGTFACGFNHEANREGISVANCSGSGCTFDPPQDPFAPTIERTPPDPAQACGAAYFDPDKASAPLPEILAWKARRSVLECEKNVGGEGGLSRRPGRSSQ